MAGIVLKNKEIAFAQITGPGKLGRNKKYNYTIAIYMTPKEKKTFLKTIEELWQEGKSAKKDRPRDDPMKWFTKKEGEESEVLWLSETVDSGISLQREPDSDFTKKHFEKMGKGSIVNVGINAYTWANQGDEGISVKLKSINLLSFKKYEGGSVDIGGVEIADDDDIVTVESEKKEKKEKKKKKKSKE